jgi:hypothetical protein
VTTPLRTRRAPLTGVAPRIDQDTRRSKPYVYATMSQYRPGQLWVYWRTDFVDPNRADYDLPEWFVRAP